MKIDYDPHKRNRTLKEGGLDMARVPEILSGPHLSYPDDRADYGEPRNITIGYLDNRMVVLVWTPRKNVTRIISLRKANGREQNIYQKRMG